MSRSTRLSFGPLCLLVACCLYGACVVLLVDWPSDQPSFTCMCLRGTPALLKELPLTSHGVTRGFSGYGHDFSGTEWAATSGAVLCALVLLAHARISHPNRQNRNRNRNRRRGLLEAT